MTLKILNRIISAMMEKVNKTAHLIHTIDLNKWPVRYTIVAGRYWYHLRDITNALGLPYSIRRIASFETWHCRQGRRKHVLIDSGGLIALTGSQRDRWSARQAIAQLLIRMPDKCPGEINNHPLWVDMNRA